VLVLPNTVASSIERAPRVVPRTLMPDQPLLVLVLGRLDPHQKGLDMLLAHLAQAPPEDVAGLHFRIVGDGDYKTRIEELLHAQPALARIVELQPWASAQHVIAESDVLLLTSRFEGVPLVMLEAMALGVPVVGSDLPGTSPYVPASTRFAVGDMRAALAILRGLRPVELRRALARSGRQTFEAHASGRAFAEHVRRLGHEIRTHFSLDEGAATAAAHRKPPHR
jgi:glycosyltransferase involved in cell wall biosynthesis